MRITEAQAERNHGKVVAKASRLFRERGFDGLSVGELMKAAGFTHGGFYNHFDSKDALVSEALDYAFREVDASRESAQTVEQFAADYLSSKAVKAPGRTCPAATLAGDVSRKQDAVKRVFEDGIERMIQFVEARLPPHPSRRSKAIEIVCGLVGALALARAMPQGSKLGQETLATNIRRCSTDAVPAHSPKSRRHHPRKGPGSRKPAQP